MRIVASEIICKRAFSLFLGWSRATPRLISYFQCKCDRKNSGRLGAELRFRLCFYLVVYFQSTSNLSSDTKEKRHACVYSKVTFAVLLQSFQIMLYSFCLGYYTTIRSFTLVLFYIVCIFVVGMLFIFMITRITICRMCVMHCNILFRTNSCVFDKSQHSFRSTTGIGMIHQAAIVNVALTLKE